MNLQRAAAAQIDQEIWPIVESVAQPAREDGIAAAQVGVVVEDLPFESGDSTLLFVNGMGGTPQIELYLAYHSASKYLKGKGIAVTRSLVGNYITSLEMQGMSITLLKLDDELTELWYAPVHTAALRWGV